MRGRLPCLVSSSLECLMAFSWTNAIADGWGVSNSVMTSLLPVIGLAIGLAVVGVIVAMFLGGRS